MLSDLDPLLASASTPYHLHLQQESSKNCKSVTEIKTTTVATMDESEKSELSLMSEAEQDRNSMDNSSPASPSDEKGDENDEEPPRMINPTSKEFKKTWGFRHTTIAKREGAGDADETPEQQQSPLVRRSGRQVKRTERIQEFLNEARRRARKSLVSGFDDPSDLASLTTGDTETSSVGSYEGITDGQNSECLGNTNEHSMSAAGIQGREEEYSSSDSDSDEMTLKELQNQLRKKNSEVMTPSLGKTVKMEAAVKEEPMVDVHSPSKKPLPSLQEQKETLKSSPGEKYNRVTPWDERPSGKKVESYDPKALYCICRQPHNNRFMICCDRCEEWFHGDCVGISEERGRLLEKNEEDYICPNCTILQGQDEDTLSTAGQALRPGLGSSGTQLVRTACSSETRHVEDQGIKGRIEKAANTSTKKKLKIFRPVAVAPAFPKCIGPGCESMAQPESVYCSHDCILKHAAAAMKSLSEGKEQKPKEKAKQKSDKSAPPKTVAQAPQKSPVGQKKMIPEAKDIKMKNVLVVVHKMEGVPIQTIKDPASESNTVSWANDHNYNAVKPEKTAAITSSVFYKSCMYHLGAYHSYALHLIQ